MAAPLRVEPERPGHRGDRKAFIALPYRLYKGHPTWVPPLRAEERKLMDESISHVKDLVRVVRETFPELA